MVQFGILNIDPKQSDPDEPQNVPSAGPVACLPGFNWNLQDRTGRHGRFPRFLYDMVDIDGYVGSK
jgi:hypothetical protein